MKISFLAIAAAVAVAVCAMVVGCGTTLAPGGPYAAMTNGTNIYKADLSIVTSYNELDAFVSWESSNHAWVASNYPAIVPIANNVRSNAATWEATAVALRNAYVANSTVSNQTAMATAIAVMQAAVNQTSNYITLKP